jgi:hypothetical protein
MVRETKFFNNMKNIIISVVILLLFSTSLFQSCSCPKKGSVAYYEEQASELSADKEIYNEDQNFCNDCSGINDTKKYQGYDGTNNRFDDKAYIQQDMYKLVKRMIVIRKQIPDSMVSKLNIETIESVDSIILQSKK